MSIKYSIRKGVLFSLLLFLPSMVWAQSAPDEAGLRLVTSPLPVNLSTTPEKPITADLKIKNDGLKTERLKVSIMKFRAYEESGQPALEELTPEDTFAQWVAFSEGEFNLAPGEWKTIQATVTPAKEAAFGYYYAFVFTRAETPQSVPGRAAIHGGSAILVLLDVVVPGAKREVTLDSFTTDKKVYEFLPVAFFTRLHNTGNVHSAPRGNIFIKNSAGEDVALLEVNFEKGNILPSSKRIFETEWTDGFPVYRDRVIDGAVVRDENGVITRDLEWDFSELNNIRMGRYTASLVLAYDNGERDIPIEGDVSFWVIPWRILAVGGVIIALILFGLYAIFRSFFSRFGRGRSSR